MGKIPDGFGSVPEKKAFGVVPMFQFTIVKRRLKKKSLKNQISFFYDVKKIVKKQQKNDVFEAFFNVVKKKIVKK